MIKKIYDRDTGNIYDVGADNKLKLVYEHESESYYVEIADIADYLEFNKIYLLTIWLYETNEEDWFDSQSLIFNTMFTNDNGDVSKAKLNTIFQDSNGTEVPAYGYLYMDTYHNGELMFYWDDTKNLTKAKLKIYELPFSL